MKRLYSLTLASHGDSTTHHAVIDNKLNTLGDWIRFSGLQWYVWSDRSKNDLYEQILASVVTGQQFIIIAVQPEFAQGIAPEWAWTWLNDKMTQQVRGA